MWPGHEMEGVTVVGGFCKNLRIGFSKLYVGNSPNNNCQGKETMKENWGSDLRETTRLNDGLGQIACACVHVRMHVCVLLSRQVLSDSLQPLQLPHTRPPCSSSSPGVSPSSGPLSQWCHPTISFPVTSFSSCPQSFPASGSFPVGWCFASGGQRTGASASASVLPMNIQGWCPLG